MQAFLQCITLRFGPAGGLVTNNYRRKDIRIETAAVSADLIS